ncbi:sugar phosphate isomerase/epimerase [Chloroflexi bacterium TSY]|nr:sugar phosphate isomerase/epimerase [Chloroflexi bacterium TSY]
MELSCTSVMLPRWTLDETFDRLGEFGYDAIELRCRYNPDDTHAEPSYWGRHLTDVSPDNIVEKAGQIRAATERSGVRVAALAPNFTYDQTEIILKLFRGALAIDSNNPPLIRIGAPRQDRSKPYLPQFLDARAGFARLTELAREHGVKVIYEIHTGTVAVSASRTIELLRDLDPEHIGAIYDVPNMIRVGIEDTRMGLELLGPYVAHCHIGNGIPVPTERDADGKMQWQWTFADLREGVADIPQVIGDLKTVGYEGAISLEEFGPGDDAEKVRDQGAYVRMLMERE